MTGDDLIAFVNLRLFPYLKKFRETAADADTIEYKVGEIFSEITNKFRSGYSLRDALEIVDTLSFNSQQAKHELSDLYETRIRRMGNAGRNGGEYYTPRPLIRAMIKVVDPKLGETIYDGACGSAGFLCEAWEYMRRDDLSASEWDTLQRRTFLGQEKKSLAYVLGVMNMILHGIEAPSIRHTNTLTENVMDIQERDRHDIVLASTRSTSNCTIRACSAGNNSSHSGSSCSSASRVSSSVMSSCSARAARHVPTMISGCRKTPRSWSMTAASISAAGTRPTGHASARASALPG